MDKQYCPVCGKELTNVEILFGFTTCFSCADLDEYFSCAEQPELNADGYEEDDECIYFRNEYDDYQELNFN